MKDATHPALHKLFRNRDPKKWGSIKISTKKDEVFQLNRPHSYGYQINQWLKLVTLNWTETLILQGLGAQKKKILGKNDSSYMYKGRKRKRISHCYGTEILKDGPNVRPLVYRENAPK